MLYQNKYRVESARRPGWDYAHAGFYFITICTRDRHHYFGEIAPVETRFIASDSTSSIAPTAAPQMVLSDLGRIAEQFWRGIPQQFSFARVDEFVVMPNHVHGIIQIVDAADGAKSDAINRVSTSNFR